MFQVRRQRLSSKEGIPVKFPKLSSKLATVAAALACLMIAAFVIVPKVHAADAYASEDLVYRVPLTGSAIQWAYSGVADDRASQLPRAYLCWTNTGSKFYARRNTTGLTTYETLVISVPENQPIVLTPLQAIRVSDTYFHGMEFNGTSGDTLCILPLR
jgi:hypothetical protein